MGYGFSRSTAFAAIEFSLFGAGCRSLTRRTDAEHKPVEQVVQGSVQIIRKIGSDLHANQQGYKRRRRSFSAASRSGVPMSSQSPSNASTLTRLFTAAVRSSGASLNTPSSQPLNNDG